ncbi:hypothetical protein AVEN_45024-1 [Araneus ventricosus]|uniref:Uncharacterized protein n=1 Tax=Araneus ventricosus TaxID=182803 RepID=A0A4Y2I7M5_ARAVE|nr:hypothetical protein AVEN_45024-1 [Araneus ventricosus]
MIHFGTKSISPHWQTSLAEQASPISTYAAQILRQKSTEREFKFYRTRSFVLRRMHHGTREITSHDLKIDEIKDHSQRLSEKFFDVLFAPQTILT